MATRSSGTQRRERRRLIVGAAAATTLVVAGGFVAPGVLGGGTGAGDHRSVTASHDRDLTVLVGSGVTDAGDTDTVRVETVPRDVLVPHANTSPPVGAIGEMSLLVHCGLRYAHIDGQTWVTTPRGGGSAPRGWPEPLTRTATRTDRDTVIFDSPGVADRLVFHPVAQRDDDVVCF